MRDRIVELQGTITEDSARQAMVVAAENVPGVHAVHDHLVWVEPVSGMTVLPQDTAPRPRTLRDPVGIERSEGDMSHSTETVLAGLPASGETGAEGAGR